MACCRERTKSLDKTDGNHGDLPTDFYGMKQMDGWTQLFSNYFNQAPKLNIPGYTFPVQEFYLEVLLCSDTFVMYTFL